MGGSMSVLTVMLLTGGSFAFAADTSRPYFNPVTREAVKEALKTGNFDVWRTLTEGRRIGELVTEDNFEKFAEAFRLREEGDEEEARAILKEIGVKHRFRRDFKFMRGFGTHSMYNKDIAAAIKVGDYNAFKEVTADTHLSGITEEQFSVITEAHRLMEAGDRDAARELIKEHMKDINIHVHR